ncbi:MAG: xanthine dehydrogenase family protein subunit M [Acidobacteriota bacterium]
MKTFRNVNPKTMAEATRALAVANSVPVGGGSDLLGMVKERLITPDTLVNLKSIPNMDQIVVRGTNLHIGGLVTLDAIAKYPDTRGWYTVLLQAAKQVGTPQIRNAGTIAGNVLQRPWCWYYRNHFPCYKNGGNTCFSVVGENEFHAIFGGGPSYIVHPSDTAPALVALNARFRIVGATAEREVAAADFFQLPSVNPAKENALAPGEILAEIIVPAPMPGMRGTYIKVLDREAWTHAVVSVAALMEMNGAVCRSARVVLGGVAPIPWRVPAVEAMLAGQKITEDLLIRAGEKAIEGARPLAKNAYKLPLTKATVKQALRAASGVSA